MQRLDTCTATSHIRGPGSESLLAPNSSFLLLLQLWVSATQMGDVDGALSSQLQFDPVSVAAYTGEVDWLISFSPSNKLKKKKKAKCVSWKDHSTVSRCCLQARGWTLESQGTLHSLPLGDHAFLRSSRKLRGNPQAGIFTLPSSLLSSVSPVPRLLPMGSVLLTSRVLITFLLHGVVTTAEDLSSRPTSLTVNLSGTNNPGRLCLQVGKAWLALLDVPVLTSHPSVLPSAHPSC